jgi:hypothetical protein
MYAHDSFVAVYSDNGSLLEAPQCACECVLVPIRGWSQGVVSWQDANIKGNQASVPRRKEHTWVNTAARVHILTHVHLHPLQLRLWATVCI